MGLADDWGKVYNKSIQAFSGRKKVAVRELQGVLEGAGPIVASLAILDENDPSLCKKDEVSARHKKYVAENKNLQKAAAKYGACIDKAIEETHKDIWPDAYRELKVLRKQLDAITSKAESRIATTSKEYEKEQAKIGGKIAKVTEKTRSKGGSDSDVGEATNYLKQQRLMIGWQKVTKAALAKAVATVQKIKADPTAKTYNDEMWSGGRDLTQQMINVIKLMQDPKCPKEIVKLMNGLSAYRNHLAEFGDGAKRRIDVNTAKNDVMALVKEFSQLTKEMIPYYDIMAKYLTKNKV